jgi:dihydrofolate reductase
MRKILLLEHVSLDGFLAGPNGEMDWIRVDQEVFSSTAAIFDTADAAIFGRTTYHMMESYWPTAGEQPDASPHDVEHSNWLNNSTIYVFSTSLESAPWGSSRSATLVRDSDLGRTVIELKSQPGKDMVMIGSASLANAFIGLGAIDEYWLFLNPVILGQGMPLYPTTALQQNLELLTSQQFACGVTGLHYVVVA